MRRLWLYVLSLAAGTLVGVLTRDLVTGWMATLAVLLIGLITIATHEIYEEEHDHR